MVGLESSETGEFFQSEGSVIATKAAGVTAYEKIIVPNPRNVPSMFRSLDKYAVDIHASVDEFVAAENPMVKLPALMDDLARMQMGRTIDALGVHLMTAVSGAMYRNAQQFIDRDSTGWTAQDGTNKRCAVYYSIPGITISSPLDAIIKMRLITMLADRLFMENSRFLPLLGHLMNQLTNTVNFTLNNKTVEELLAAPELQLLTGINGIIAGARRMPLMKQMYMGGSTGRFFDVDGPAGTPAQLIETFGPEMADYIDETLAAIRAQCNYRGARVENAIEGATTFSMLDLLDRLRTDIWNEGTPILWMNELAASIRIFRAAQKTAGKMRVRMGDRTRDYQEMIYNLDALEVLLSSIPEVSSMNWTYCTDRYHMKTQFGGWSFTPERYRIYYGILNPLAELAALGREGITGEVARRVIEGASIMTYEPIAMTRRSAVSDWVLDVPADHMAVEIPVVHWLPDTPESRSMWMEMKEWCRSQTSRVVRPSKLKEPFLREGVDGIFPLNPSVMEGSVMATAIINDSMITVDKERTLSKVDGNVCLPLTTLFERRATGMSLYQLPDRTVIAENDPSYVSEVPASWKY